jgi:hypothetical protein
MNIICIGTVTSNFISWSGVIVALQNGVGTAVIDDTSTYTLTLPPDVGLQHDAMYENWVSHLSPKEKFSRRKFRSAKVMNTKAYNRKLRCKYKIIQKSLRRRNK